jgi:hypothetical protein
MSNFNYSAFNMLDLQDAFKALPQRNYLLQALGLFNKVGSDSVRIGFDRLVETNKSLLNDPQKRYSYQHNATSLDGASFHSLILPYYMRQDTISSADFQKGNRRPGRNDEETFTDILGDYISKHQIAHSRTVELAYAQALFQGKVFDPEDESTLIDYAASFDAPYLNGTLDLSTDSTNVLEAFDEFQDKVNDSVGGLYSSVSQIICFAGASAYKALKYHASLKEAFTYVLPMDAGNIIVHKQDLIPNVQYFTMPGTNIRVVKVNDPLLTPYVSANELVFVPVMAAGSDALIHYYGPASASVDLARSGDVQEVFTYTLADAWGKTDVVYESNILPVNNMTNMILKVQATV